MRNTILNWCAASLVAAATPLAALAQTPTGVSEQQATQTYGSATDSTDAGARVAETKCAACHGLDGNSRDPQYPKLAGQNPNYLYWQLQSFRNGVRASDIMSPMVASLSDGDVAAAASYYARQARQPDPIKDEALVFSGKRVFFLGAGGGMGPPCAMCHGSAGQRRMPMMGRMPMGPGMMGMMGPGMMGMMADIPSLDGQHANYVIDQLNRFATGQRQGTMMNRIAAALTEADKRAVAEFVSSVR